MTRAAIILNPATADASALRDAVEKTMVSAGWSTPMWLETTPEDPGAGMAETAVAVSGGRLLAPGWPAPAAQHEPTLPLMPITP